MGRSNRRRRRCPGRRVIAGLLLVVPSLVLVAEARAGTPLTLTTQARVGPPGSPVTDVATLSGGSNPTGTITFELFGPTDPTCGTPPVFISIQPVAGDGSYQADPFFTVWPGTYRWVTSYSGDTGNPPIGPSACGDPTETVEVAPIQPVTITTQASLAAPGSPVSDIAYLAGGSSVHFLGSVTFTLFGPADPTCAGPPVFTSSVPVFGPGIYPSEPFGSPAPGAYSWVASYSGDVVNAPAGPTACGDPAETVVVPPPGPPPELSLTTTALNPPPGNPLFDLATLSGGSNPTGTITFDLFGPDDAGCSGPPIFTSTHNVLGTGSYLSDSFFMSPPGTFRWVASYSGDANNLPVHTACNDPAETVVVLPPPPPAMGSLTICMARRNAVAGDHTFTVEDRTFAVAAGQCSQPIPVTPGDVIVTEAPAVGFRLAKCDTAPADRLVACNRTAGTAVVRVVPAGGGEPTVVTFINRPASGELKICKVAGIGVTTGSRHVFTVNGRRVIVRAGPPPGGGCVVVGSFPVGTQIDVVERVKPTEQVGAIVVRPANRLVGTPDLGAAKVTVGLASGVTEVRFTDVSS